MISNIQGKWYDDVILQGNYPKIVDVSAADFDNPAFQGNQVSPAVQRPFIICQDEPVTLKVEPWLGEVVIWNFTAGPYPMPLRRIIKDAANSKTTIQIAY